VSAQVGQGITINVVGIATVQANLLAAPKLVASNLRTTLNVIANQLVRYIKESKLSGQVLKVRTGTLRRSITRWPQSGVEENATGNMRVAVGTNVFYGRIWELTGTPAMTIYPKKGKFLVWGKGKNRVFAKKVNKPAVAPKPWLRPALLDNEAAIRRRLNIAVQAGVAGLRAK
jgi:hypothetical protein